MLQALSDLGAVVLMPVKAKDVKVGDRRSEYDLGYIVRSVEIDDEGTAVLGDNIDTGAEFYGSDVIVYIEITAQTDSPAADETPVTGDTQSQKGPQ